MIIDVPRPWCHITFLHGLHPFVRSFGQGTLWHGYLCVKDKLENNAGGRKGLAIICIMGEFLATDKKQIMDIRMSQNQSYTQSSCFRQTSSLALIVVLLQVSKPSDHILKKNKRHHVTYLVVHAYAFNIRCEEACFQHCLRLALGLLNYWEFPKALA